MHDKSHGKADDKCDSHYNRPSDRRSNGDSGLTDTICTRNNHLRSKNKRHDKSGKGHEKKSDFHQTEIPFKNGILVFKGPGAPKNEHKQDDKSEPNHFVGSHPGVILKKDECGQKSDEEF